MPGQCSFHAFLLYDVIGVADAGRVRQQDGISANVLPEI
jgi:hypothetical protein